MRILHVVGARPHFVKAAPVLAALNRKPDLSQILVHTGQHYDRNMSDVFFGQLGISAPSVNLAVGSGTHGILSKRPSSVHRAPTTHFGRS